MPDVLMDDLASIGGILAALSQHDEVALGIQRPGLAPFKHGRRPHAIGIQLVSRRRSTASPAPTHKSSAKDVSRLNDQDRYWQSAAPQTGRTVHAACVVG